MKFYHSTATCSLATHITLRESGLAFEPVEVSWKRNVNIEALAKVNPLGAVPALVTDSGQVLTQSTVIMEYVADLAPAKRLLPPAGSPERREAMAWVTFAAADFQRAFTPILAFDHMSTLPAARGELRAYATGQIQQYLQHVDTSLHGRDFVTGKDFTIADAYLFTVIGWCKWAEIPISGYANIAGYLKRIAERPAVRDTLKDEGMPNYLPE